MHVFARWPLLNSSLGPFDFCIGPQAFVSVCNEDLALGVSSLVGLNCSSFQ
jgi:hypothetical protein